MLVVKDGIITSLVPAAGTARHEWMPATSLDDVEACGREAGEAAGKELRRRFGPAALGDPLPWLAGLEDACDEAQIGQTPERANAWLMSFDAAFLPHLKRWAALRGLNPDAFAARGQRWPMPPRPEIAPLGKAQPGGMMKRLRRFLPSTTACTPLVFARMC